MLRLIWSFLSIYCIALLVVDTFYACTSYIVCRGFSFGLILFVSRDFPAPIWDAETPLKICAMQFITRTNKFFECNQTDFLNEFLVRDVRCHFTPHTHYTHHFNRSASISFLFLAVCLLVLLFTTFVWDRSKYKKPKQKSYFTFFPSKIISSNATKRTLQFTMA